MTYLKNFKALLLALGTASLLSACASTPEECDPSKDQGYFGKMGCVFSGSYQERVDQKEQHLADLKAETEQLNALARDFHAKSAQLYKDNESRLKLLNQVEDELNDLESKLAAKKALSLDLQDKLDAAKNQVQKMKHSDAGAEMIKKKEAEKSVFEKQLADLKEAILLSQ